MSHQSALNLLAQDPHAQAMVAGVPTPGLEAFVKHFYETWAITTTFEERQRLLEASMNPSLASIHNSGQFIPSRMNNNGSISPSRLSNNESITPINFIRGSEGWADMPKVLISPNYNVSYIFIDTLRAYGRDFAPVKVRHTQNPKGGRLFEPIGIATLFLQFPEGSEYRDYLDVPFFVNFHVLNEQAAGKGVLAILGMPEIQRIFGTANLL